jgi:hypothetical protein
MVLVGVALAVVVGGLVFGWLLTIPTPRRVTISHPGFPIPVGTLLDIGDAGRCRVVGVEGLDTLVVVPLHPWLRRLR